MKVIGLNIEKYIGKSVSGHNGDFDYQDADFERKIIYLEYEGGGKYEVVLFKEEGECGSGWCTASFGKVLVHEIEKFPAMMFKSTDKSEQDFELPVFTEYGCFNSVDNKFFSVSFDGGDNYYPSGGYSVNMEMFTTNGRGISSNEDIKRKVWIFKGKSGSGKTFLSDKIDLSKYETDCSENLPDELKEDIIVIGNKYKFKVKDIKKRIINSDDCEIIVVNFS